MTDETIAETAVAQVAVDVKKEAENEGHSHLQELLAWLKAKFESVQLDIETELKKL